MKILLPEHIGDITLGQYQRYIALIEKDNLIDKVVNLVSSDKRNKQKIEIFTGLNIRSINDISKKDKDEILKQIDNALEITPEFKNTFTLNNINFGFIPNFDNIDGAEYIDISRYQDDPTNLHRLMAVLFRPIKNKDSFKNYKITRYKGTSEYCELMKEMPLSYVNGALSFFLNLSDELENYTLAYTVQELERVQML